MTTWFYRGIGQMTMFDHEGGGGVKISENLTTWYMDAPYQILIFSIKFGFIIVKNNGFYNNGLFAFPGLLYSISTHCARLIGIFFGPNLTNFIDPDQIKFH